MSESQDDINVVSALVRAAQGHVCVLGHCRTLCLLKRSRSVQTESVQLWGKVRNQGRNPPLFHLGVGGRGGICSRGLSNNIFLAVIPWLPPSDSRFRQCCHARIFNLMPARDTIVFTMLCGKMDVGRRRLHPSNRMDLNSHVCLPRRKRSLE